MILTALSLLIFVVTLGLSLSLLYFMVESPLARRKMMTRLAAVQEVSIRNDEASDVLRKELLSDMPALHRILAMAPGIARLRLFLEQGAIRMQVGSFVLISVALLVFVFLATVIAGLPLYEGLPAALGAGAIPTVIASAIRQRRFNKFEEQFPEALDLLGRAVRAGHAFTTGLEMIAKECAEPLAGEFRTTFEEQNFGLPLRDALLNLTERVPIIDVRFFVTALLIQKETGGNLAEILDGLSRVIRDRFRIYREVRVRTAQGRLTAGILIALPIMMGFILSVLNPKYIGVLFTDPLGPIVLVTAAVMQIIGSAILWKIIHFEV